MTYVVCIHGWRIVPVFVFVIVFEGRVFICTNTHVQHRIMLLQRTDVEHVSRCELCLSLGAPLQPPPHIMKQRDSHEPQN